MKKPISILVVDDELGNFDVLEDLLYPEGYHLNYASNGLQALQSLELSPPDLILLDVMMPGINGIEVCRKVKSMPQWRTIPILMVTALTQKEDLARCLDAGADDFISKPVNGVELRARVRSLLRMKRQYDELQESLQLREDMAYMMVHDLKNPLTAVVLGCDILKMTDLSAIQQTRVEQIAIAGQELNGLVDGLLMMAKLESGKLVPQYGEIDLHDLGERVITGFRAIAAQKKIELIDDLPLPGTLLWADVLLLRRILDNLLSNAIKFSSSQTQIHLSIQSCVDGRAIFQVKDQGKGVSDELKQAIFEKFEIGDILKNVSQTGLGLAFVKMATEAHQGKVFVTDNQPQGAIFTVEIGDRHD